MSAAPSAPSPPPARGGGTSRRVVVIGGNGYVGSHILQELLSRRGRGEEPALRIASISRSGRPPQGNPAWARDVEWLQGDALQAQGQRDSSFARALEGSTAVISTVGGFGSAERMRQINGVANAAAMDAARAVGVPRFVYISAHHYKLPSFLQKGYFEGKFLAEGALREKYGSQGVAIRPGFIFGTRQVGSVGLPLWVVGSPLQMLTNLSLVRGVTQIPFIGGVLAPLLLPPVSVHAVAKAAVDAALAPGAPSKTVVEVDDLLALEP